ncbi:hypothetical protein [Microlunatus ginsengisoli]|uniref:Uncharacterized protein n=1 Tax=Microlunatus ginsengisoli TaxID=363863 RepID=A0ABP7AKP4_9ACTN
MTGPATAPGRGRPFGDWTPSRGGTDLPPADLAPADSRRADRFRSRCPHPEVTCPNRFDPYWDALWGRSSSLSWMTADTVDAQQRAGLVSMSRRMSRPGSEARRLALKPEGWQRRLRLLGAAGFWRTLSAEQAAAVTGDLTVLDFERQVPFTLYRAGLIDVGAFNGVLRQSKYPQPRTVVYRPSNTTVFDKHLAPHLTWPEWVSVTGGRPWSAASQFDRHNLLAAELGLRLQEYADDVGAVVGENLSTIDLLAGSGLGRALPDADNRAADLTLIRNDGLRVAVEITATTTGTFKSKVERWCRLLADLPLEDSGLVVVFVVADPVERHGAGGKATRAAAGTIINQMTRRYPGWVGNRVAERIGIADWREWFPGRHQLSGNFLDLRCLTPSGPPDALWQEHRWLARDPGTGGFATGFDPARDRADFTAVIDNVQSLVGVPHWARDPERGVRMWQVMIAERGHDHFPIPVSARPDRLKGPGFGVPAGAASAPLPPARLRGL